MQDGETVIELRKRIEEVYAQATTTRAERIARTETIAASNQAALEAYRQSPVVSQKEFFAEPDACEFCRAFSGKVIGLETSFAALGETIIGADGGEMSVTFTDIDTPPVHPHCRCTILPVSSVQLSAPLIKMEQQYRDMDKRTREARLLLEKIKTEREKFEQEKKLIAQEKKDLEYDKQEVDELLGEIEKIIHEPTNSKTKGKGKG